MNLQEQQINPRAVEDAADKLVRQSFLFDFYGELLNEHQRSIYEAYVCDNLSLSEIAEESNVSRQSVHDLIRRCDEILERYESKLHLLETFQMMKKDVTAINKLASGGDLDSMQKIKEISEKILLEL